MGESFRPERFLTEEGKLHKPAHFMPFAAGQRMCLGDKIAEMELQLFFTSLLHVFDIENPCGSGLPSLRGLAGVTVSPADYEVNFIPRNISAHGKSIGSGDAQSMLDEVDGPMNFTQMATLFASKMAGGSDDNDVILASFEAFEIDGKIDAYAFRHSLMTFGVKFSASEVDDAFAEMKIDEGMIDAAHLKGLMVSK